MTLVMFVHGPLNGMIDEAPDSCWSVIHPERAMVTVESGGGDGVIEEWRPREDSRARERQAVHVSGRGSRAQEGPEVQPVH